MDQHTARQRAHDEFERYAELDPGWDGENGTTPTTEAVKCAQSFLKALGEWCPVPSTMLGANGRVGFYWNCDQGYLDIEVEPDGTCSLYLRSKVGSGRDNLYPSLTVAETVALYSAYVQHWVLV